MTRMLLAGTLLLTVIACGDPATEDRRGYTKAPLEDPGLLIGAEEATVMAAMNRPVLPRPPLDIDVPGADDVGEEEAAEQEVTLAPGVTRARFDQGRQLFSGQAGCQACHGPNAAGTQLAPDLTDAEWLNLSEPDLASIAEVIRTGVPSPVEYPAPMPPMGGANLDADQVQALAAYVASISQG